MILMSYLEAALEEYLSKDKYEILVNAKENYFKRVGRVNEEDIEFESSMNCFNDWFLMQYKSQEMSSSVMEDYLQRYQFTSDVLLCNHSLFEFSGINRRKCYCMKDILHDQNIVLSAGHELLSFVKGDLFLGRIAQLEEEILLMRGVCLLPLAGKKIFIAQCKKQRKLKDPQAEKSFLIQLESCKIQYMKFGHRDVEEFFVFKDLKL